MHNRPNSSEHDRTNDDLDSVKLDSDIDSDSVELDSTPSDDTSAFSTSHLSDDTADRVTNDERPIATTEPAIASVGHAPKAAHVTTGNSMTPISRLTKTPKMIANGSRAFAWYALSLLVLALDQFTKWLAETNLTFNEPVPVIEPFLNWTLAYNYGAAFSFLADAGGWQKWFFSGLALVMAIFLTVYLTRAPRQAKLLSLGLALVLGGAVGNLIDRLRLGKVVDFIHVHYADVWHYPIFNIADMAIMIGVAMIVIDMIFLEKKRQS